MRGLVFTCMVRGTECTYMRPKTVHSGAVLAAQDQEAIYDLSQKLYTVLKSLLIENSDKIQMLLKVS